MASGKNCGRLQQSLALQPVASPYREGSRMTDNYAARDLATIAHPYANLATLPDQGPVVMERGDGVYVYDSAGKPYLEGMSGLWCASLGFSNAELVEAAREQMARLPFNHLFAGRSHDPAIALAEKLKDMAPIPVSRVFFCNSGSEANDTQIKLVWYMNNALGRPNKKKIISRQRAYHGVTIASASLTGLPGNHADFDLPIAGILHTACPHHYRYAHEGESEEDFATRLANELEEMILREGPDTVAAFIAEPVMGAGGVIVPPAGYFEKIQAVLDRHDVYMIADEVICGFGRLGEMFGSQALGMRPDSMSLAKALSAAYMPISAVLIPERMYQAMVDESRKNGAFYHGFTYSGHPVAAAVALKTIEIYERDDIVGHVRKVAPLFQQRLREFTEHPLVGEARGMGLMGALELVADRATKTAFPAKAGVGAMFTRYAAEEGLIARSLGDSMALCPPLIITESEIDLLFARLAIALDRTTVWVNSTLK